MESVRDRNLGSARKRATPQTPEFTLRVIERRAVVRLEAGNATAIGNLRLLTGAKVEFPKLPFSASVRREVDQTAIARHAKGGRLNLDRRAGAGESEFAFPHFDVSESENKRLAVRHKPVTRVSENESDRKDYQCLER
jgi:hypothetical protein